MNRLYIPFIFLFILINHVNSQDFNPEYLTFHDDYVPPTPNASNIKIYGDLPVSHASGIPQIDIPIFTLEEDGVKIPISLSYHASGVKVDDLASVVGLKWTLNAGGGVFRQVNDEPDETGWLNNNNRGFVDPSWLASQPGLNYQSTQNLISDSDAFDDYFPDDFNFKFLNYSGNFIFNKNGSIAKEFVNALQINKIDGIGHLFDFEVLDGLGNTFQFGSKNDNNINTNAKEFSSQYITVGGTNAGTLSQNRSDYNTGWLLEKVNTRNNKTISFSYLPYTVNYDLNNISNSISFVKSCNLDSGPVCGCEGDEGGYNTNIISTSINYSMINKLPSIIETSSVKILFSYSEDTSLATWKLKLDSITILDKIENKSKFFRFVYGQFSGDARLRLDEIQEVGFDGTIMPPYKFFYVDGRLPFKGSLAKDSHGYYNGKSNSTLVPYSTTAYSTLPSVYHNDLANRHEDFNYLKIGVLNKIKYPTGGTTEFVYEANAVPAIDGTNPSYIQKTLNLSNQNSSYTQISGGYTLFQSPFTIKEELLGNLETPVHYNGSSNLCDYDPQYPNIDCSRFNIYPRTDKLIDGPAIFSQNQVIWSDESINLSKGDYMLELIVETSQLNNEPNGLIQINLDWTEEVEQSDQTYYAGGLRIKGIKDKNSNGSLIKSTEFSYENLISSVYDISNTMKSYGEKIVFSSDKLDVHPAFNKTGYYYQNVTKSVKGAEGDIKTIERFNDTFGNKSFEPQIVEEELYSGNLKVKTIKYEYSNIINNTTQFWVLGYIDYCYNWVNSPRLGYNNPNSLNYFHRENVLSKRREIDYSSSPENPFSAVIKFFNYEYNDNLFIIKEELDGRYFALNQLDIDNDNLLFDSEGDYLINEYSFPDDYMEETFFSEMVRNHLIGFPVSKKTFNHEKLVFGQFLDYDIFGNVTEVYRFNKGEETNISTSTHIPENYKLFVEYSYLRGKPVEIKQTDGSIITLLWDFYDKYLMAEAKNVSYDDITSLSSFGVNPNIDCTGLTIIQENDIRSFPNSLITTYKHKPLVGTTSITDQRAESINYSYDGLGRLITIKDNSENILSDFQYHYKGQ